MFLECQFSINGRFKVSEAYQTLCDIVVAIEEVDKWNTVWSFKGPIRYGLLLWKIWHGRLMKWEMLRNRHYLPNPLCPICTQAPKTALHTQQDYSWAHQVWEGVFLLYSWHDFYSELGIRSWVDLCLRKYFGQSGLMSNDVEWQYLFWIVLSAIQRRIFLWIGPYIGLRIKVVSGNKPL